MLAADVARAAYAQEVQSTSTARAVCARLARVMVVAESWGLWRTRAQEVA